MHSKRKGNVGQFATGLCLAKFGYSVFTEEGDISAIDMIAEKEGKLLKFQCKAVTPKEGKIIMPLRKCGPGYIKKYEQCFDYFSVYDLIGEQLYFVSSDVLNCHDSAFIIRLSESKNNQKKGVHLANEYNADKVLAALVT